MLLDLFRSRPRGAVERHWWTHFPVGGAPMTRGQKCCWTYFTLRITAVKNVVGPIPRQPGSASIRAFLTSNGWFLIHWLATNKYRPGHWLDVKTPVIEHSPIDFWSNHHECATNEHGVSAYPSIQYERQALWARHSAESRPSQAREPAADRLR
jgi:hypothetical protein